MADEFTLRVDVASLQALEKVLSDVGAQCEEEGAKLAGMPAQAGDWTGNTATTLKTAMSTIGADMRQSAPHFATAVTAVSTFRTAVEQAQEDVAGLNTAWAAAATTYSDAVAKADAAYADGKDTTPAGAWKADEPERAQTRSSAKSSAADVLATTQRWLGASYVAIVQDLQDKATVCGQALEGAVSRAVPPDVVKRHLDGSAVGYGFSAAAYLTGGSPFPSPVTAVEQSLVDKGVLPPECAGMTAEQLQKWLLDHPDVARKLAGNVPYPGDPSSPETQLALLLQCDDPNATGATAEGQRTVFRDLFETLSPQDQLLLATLFPTQTGNTGGVPFAARSAAGRVTMIVAKDDLRTQIAEYWQTKPYNGAWTGEQEWQDHLKTMQDQLALYDGVLQDPSRLVVLFDAPSGKFAEASGPIDASTKNVAVIVPGTGTNLSNIDGNVARYDGFAEASPGGSLVTITWMGGKLPQSLVPDATEASWSRELGPGLAEFSKEVRQEVTSSAAVDNDVQLTLAGHSYGGAVVGVAEANNADADRILYIEAAGMGNDITPADQNPVNPDVKRYSMTAPGDIIGDVQGLDVGSLGLGGDPDTWPGTTRLETGYYQDGTLVQGPDSHGGVFNQGSDSWRQMYEVFTGGHVLEYGGNEPEKILVPAVAMGSGVWVDNPEYNPDPKIIDIP